MTTSVLSSDLILISRYYIYILILIISFVNLANQVKDSKIKGQRLKDYFFKLLLFIVKVSG